MYKHEIWGDILYFKFLQINKINKYLTSPWPWPWPFDHQNKTSLCVPSTTSSTKVWWSSQWVCKISCWQDVRTDSRRDHLKTRLWQFTSLHCHLMAAPLGNISGGRHSLVAVENRGWTGIAEILSGQRRLALHSTHTVVWRNLYRSGWSKTTFSNFFVSGPK